MGAIRGAICAENTVADIEKNAIELVDEILAQNNLKPSDVDAVFFTATCDLNACYPAKAVRLRFEMTKVAFMCLAEMNVIGGLDHCLRVCVFAPKIQQNNVKHCYIGRAKQLRNDL